MVISRIQRAYRFSLPIGLFHTITRKCKFPLYTYTRIEKLECRISFSAVVPHAVLPKLPTKDVMEPRQSISNHITQTVSWACYVPAILSLTLSNVSRTPLRHISAVYHGLVKIILGSKNFHPTPRFGFHMFSQSCYFYALPNFHCHR